MTILYGLVGASGFGSEVMPILERSIDSKLKDEYQISFIDIDQSKKMFNSKKVMSEEEFLRNQRELFYDRKQDAALQAVAEAGAMGGEGAGGPRPGKGVGGGSSRATWAGPQATGPRWVRSANAEALALPGRGLAEP